MLLPPFLFRQEKPVYVERIDYVEIHWIDNRRVLDLYTPKQIYRCWDYCNFGDDYEEDFVSGIIGKPIKEMTPELESYKIDFIQYQKRK